MDRLHVVDQLIHKADVIGRRSHRGASTANAGSHIPRRRSAAIREHRNEALPVGDGLEARDIQHDLPGHGEAVHHEHQGSCLVWIEPLRNVPDEGAVHATDLEAQVHRSGGARLCRTSCRRPGPGRAPGCHARGG